MNEKITINQDKYFTLEVSDEDIKGDSIIQKWINLELKPYNDYVKILEDKTREEIIEDSYLVARELCKCRNEIFKLKEELRIIKEHPIISKFYRESPGIKCYMGGRGYGKTNHQLQQENKQLKDRIEKAFQLLQIFHHYFPDYDKIHHRIQDIEDILKESGE